MPLDGTDQHDAPLDGQVEHRYTILEAARLLGIHKNTVRHRIRTGVYTAEPVLTPHGEAFVIPAHYIDAELEAIASGRTQKGTGTTPNNGVVHPESTAVSVPGAFDVDLQALVDELRETRTQAAQTAQALGQEQGLRQAAEQREHAAVEEAKRERDRARDLQRALDAERSKGVLQRLFDMRPRSVQ